MAEDRIWGKLLVISDAIGDLKTDIGICATNIKAQAEIVAILAAHMKESNGNVTTIVQRLSAIELASAEDRGEKVGARHQWAIIGGSLGAGAALAAIVTSIGFIAGLW